MSQKELILSDALRFDFQAKTLYNTSKLLKWNTGKGKTFLGGPEYIINGITMLCLITQAEKGSIISKILTAILGKVDQFNIYKRKTGGPTLILIVDSYSSSLQTPFLVYQSKSDTISRYLWCVVLAFQIYQVISPY